MEVNTEPTAGPYETFEVQSPSSFKNINSDEDGNSETYKATLVELISFGICIIAQDLFWWNSGLFYGIWPFLTATIWTASWYICMILCLAEMTSTMPFSGGAYGFARMAINPYVGFIVGICELVHNLVYIYAALWPLSDILCDFFHTSTRISPAFWVIFFVIAVPVQIHGGRLFWWFVRILALYSLMVISIYIFGNISSANFEEYALQDDPGYFSREASPKDGINSFLYAASYASWWFVGVETVALCGRDCLMPRKSIPRAISICILLASVLSIALLLIACSNSPGTIALQSTLVTLAPGLSKVFGLSIRSANMFVLVPYFSTAFATLWVFQRQRESMASSGLLPKIFYGGEASPSFIKQAVSYSIGAVISFLLLVIMQFTHQSVQIEVPLAANIVCQTALLCEFCVYYSIFISYLIFAWNYRLLRRQFINPLGTTSAIFGFIAMTINLIGIVGFSDKTSLGAIVGFLTIFSISTIVYFTYTRYNQSFSKHEEKVLFAGYLINANRIKRLKKRVFKGSSSERVKDTFSSKTLSASNHKEKGSEKIEDYVIRVFSTRSSDNNEDIQEQGLNLENEDRVFSLPRHKNKDEKSNDACPSSKVAIYNDDDDSQSTLPVDNWSLIDIPSIVTIKPTSIDLE